MQGSKHERDLAQRASDSACNTCKNVSMQASQHASETACKGANMQGSKHRSQHARESCTAHRIAAGRCSDAACSLPDTCPVAAACRLLLLLAPVPSIKPVLCLLLTVLPPAAAAASAVHIAVHSFACAPLAFRHVRENIAVGVGFRRAHDLCVELDCSILQDNSSCWRSLETSWQLQSSVASKRRTKQGLQPTFGDFKHSNRKPLTWRSASSVHRPSALTICCHSDIM